MASSSATAGHSLAHRSVANIRAGGAGVGSSVPHSPPGSGAGGPGSPHTPLRNIASTFASPSSLRAEEDVIVVEPGARRVRVGFAGDPAPKACVEFGPEHSRRVGDWRAWHEGFRDDWRRREGVGPAWCEDRELWRSDLRGLDLGLVADKLERGLRDAFSRYLLIDSRPRRVVLVLPPAMPLPLISVVLDTLFGRLQSPYVSLLSSPVVTTAAAGLRSALVVDLGWAETVVTSVYEYREVACTRTVRGGRMLVEQTHHLLSRSLSGSGALPPSPSSQSQPPPGEEERVVSVEECEDVVSRMVWCRHRGSPTTHGEVMSTDLSSDGLPTVAEQDETETAPVAPVPPPPPPPTTANIPLSSGPSPVNLELPFESLAAPCENTFFESELSPASFDDHELPVPLLVYRHLLSLPLDARAVCMSRIIFTGGCANVLGLRGRIFDEVAELVRDHGWDPIRGNGYDKVRANPKLQKSFGASTAPSQKDSGAARDPQLKGVTWNDAADAPSVPDPVEELMQRSSGNADLGGGRSGRSRAATAAATASVQGELRAVESLGPWAGASLVAQLKVPAIATVDRELWLQQGAAGASRAGDVDLKAQQRQSMGPAGGLMRGAAGGVGAGANSTWTLGAWGSL